MEAAPTPWELLHAAPDRRLADLVQRYTGFRAALPVFGEALETATPKTVLIVNFGAPFEIDYPDDGLGWRRPDCFLAGFGERRAVNRATGPSHCLQVDFTPRGGRLFLGLAMDQLSNRVVELEALLGSGANELRERLREAPGWVARFALMDRLLLARAAAAERLLDSASWRLAGWLEERLAATAGRVAIVALAEAAGVSHRHLIAVSRAELGVTPKTYARVLRFNRAERLIAGARKRGGRPDWAGLALAAGYYDQAHFIREFRALTGHSPGSELATVALA